MSSRLFQNIREKRGLAYSVFSGINAYRDAGSLTVYAGCANEAVGEVIDLTVEELKGIKQSPVPESELRRAKDHLKGSLMLSLESTSSRMNRVAKQELRFGSFFSLDEMLGAIDGVQPPEVEALISRILDEQQLSLLTLGPIDRRNLPRELLNS